MAAVVEIGRKARAASRAAQKLNLEDRNRALSAVHEELTARRAEIIAANELDRKLSTEKGVEATLMKRLDLRGAKYDAMLTGVKSVLALSDPVGTLSMARELDDGLELYRISTPIGVLAIIFEARPEAGIQIASLAIKSSNAIILKGGSEAINSNKAIADAIRAGLRKAEYPEDTVQLLTTREEVGELLACDEYIDLIIPRGSNALVKHVQDNTKIPVMGHADGLCAVYVDVDADIEKAERIVVDAKTHYPAVCNAAETLLVARGAAKSILQTVGGGLVEKGVQLRADAESYDVLKSFGFQGVVAATEEDFRTEFLDLRIAVKVVADVNEAVAHINSHGSGHTDVIVSENTETAKIFMAGVDSAGVFHNASSRFADGFRYGFGAEVGISTHRTHARGPVGVEGLLIYKYKLIGNGHIVKPYADGTTPFTHRDLDLSR